jgi:hypothetical protein
MPKGDVLLAKVTAHYWHGNANGMGKQIAENNDVKQR